MKCKFCKKELEDNKMPGYCNLTCFNSHKESQRLYNKNYNLKQKERQKRYRREDKLMKLKQETPFVYLLKTWCKYRKQIKNENINLLGEYREAMGEKNNKYST